MICRQLIIPHKKFSAPEMIMLATTFDASVVLTVISIDLIALSNAFVVPSSGNCVGISFYGKGPPFTF